MTKRANSEAEPPNRTEVLAQLWLMSREGVLTANEKKVLVYMAEQWLDGRAADVSGKSILADVFGRDLREYDAKREPLARVTVSSIRKKLQEYYANEGSSSAITLRIPPSGYQLDVKRRLPLGPADMGRLWNAQVLLEQRTPDGFQKALQLLNQILVRNPDLSPVLALKAEVLLTRGMYGTPPLPDLHEAQRLLDRIFDVGDSDWRSHLVQGAMHAVMRSDWSKAFSSLEQSLRMNRGECSVHPWYTACLVAQGRTAEAVHLMRSAVSDGGYHVPTVRADLSILEIVGRQYEAAEETVQTTIEMFPNYYLPYLHRALLEHQRGDSKRSVETLHCAPLRLSERPVTWGNLAFFHGGAGAKGRAFRMLKLLQGISKVRFVPAGQLALAAIGAGLMEEAVTYVVAACETEKDPHCLWAYAFPQMYPLQGMPGYEQLLDRLGIVRF